MNFMYLLKKTIKCCRSSGSLFEIATEMEVSSGRAERRARSARCPKDTQHKPSSAVSAGFPLPRGVACHQELLSTARFNVASDSERVCLIDLLSTEGLNGLPVRPRGCGLEPAISS